MSLLLDSLSAGIIDARLEQAFAASAEGDGALVLALCEQIIQEQPGVGPAHFLMAAEYAAQGDVAHAEAAFLQAVLWMPGFPVARYQLGLLQYSAGRPMEALVTWQPLLGLDDGHALCHWVRGFGLLAQSRWEAARAEFEVGLACPIEHPPMARDIQQVLEAMDAERLRQGDGLQPTEGRVEASEDSVGDTAHVLLSRYRPEGPAH